MEFYIFTVIDVAQWSLYKSYIRYAGCLVQHTGWTRDIELFLQWLSAIPLAGGGFSDAAIAEGLSEALMVCLIICIKPSMCKT